MLVAEKTHQVELTPLRENIINDFCVEIVSDYLDEQSDTTDQMDSNAIGKTYTVFKFIQKYNIQHSDVQVLNNS